MTGLCLGLMTGALEAACRAGPLAGLLLSAHLRWLAVALLLNGACGLLIGAASGLARGLLPGPMRGREIGLLFGIILAIQAGINYRFELFLNEFIKDPVVWGGLLGIGAGSLILGLILDQVLRRISLKYMLISCVVLSLASVVRSGPVQARRDDLPPVIVISLDTTRMDRLSPYGHAIALPNLERLAREGTVFTQAIAAAPITEPSHLAMFTGIAPFRSGVVTNGTMLGDRALVWERLQEAGWLTGGFVAGFPLHSRYGWAQGMDLYDDDFGDWPGLHRLSLVKVADQVLIREHTLRERTAAGVLSRALPWIGKNRDHSFFAFLHFYDVHGPYTAPGSTLGPPPREGGERLALPFYWPPDQQEIRSIDYLKRAYDEEIRYVDAAIGEVLDALGPRLDDALIVVTADHGESLDEHGYLFDHGDNLYDPELRVPLIVRWPGRVPAGRRVDCMVGGVDLAPTLLALLDQPVPQGLDGVARTQELAGGACQGRPIIASTVAGRMVDPPPIAHALRNPGSKLILQADGSSSFFDLVADPGELNILQNHEDAQPSLLLLKTLLSTGSSGVLPEQDAQTTDMLRLLGYVDEPVPDAPAPDAPAPDAPIPDRK